MTTPVFNPSFGPSFPVGLELSFPHTVQQDINGYGVVMPQSLRPRMAASLEYQAITDAQLAEIMSFFTLINGPQTPFVWAPPRSFWSPSAMTPTLDSTPGGALPQRTYYVRFTWYDPTTGQETAGSLTASILVPANEFLTVALPLIPLSVPAARIYASETQGDERSQGHITAPTWTQGGALGSPNITVPTASDLQTSVTWRLASGVTYSLRRANRWAVSLRFEEYPLYAA